MVAESLKLLIMNMCRFCGLQENNVYRAVGAKGIVFQHQNHLTVLRIFRTQYIAVLGLTRVHI
jgi:hypothetical protein